MDHQLSDTILIERFLANDLAAFEILVKRYQPRVKRLLRRYVHDESLLPDLCQEVFIKIYFGLQHFEQKSEFYSWMYRLVINTALSALSRAKEKWEQTLSDDDVLQQSDSETFFFLDPSHQLSCNELERDLYHSMRLLSPELQETVVLREWYGLSYEMISECLSCPVGTVRSRLARARERLLHDRS